MDLNPRTIEFALSCATSQGVSVEQLRQSMDPKHHAILSLAPEACLWASFAALLEAIAQRLGRERTIDLIAQELLVSPLSAPMRALLRSFSPPERLYRLMTFFGPRTTPCLLSDYQVLPGKPQQIALRLYGNARVQTPCSLYFEITAEVFRRAPAAYFGLAPATVTLTMAPSGLEGRFLITLPPSVAFGARLRAALGTVLGARTVLGLLREQQSELTKSYDTLARAHAELEERVAQRTRELATLNAQLAQSRDEAERASRAKSDYLANMSHEIRTPLNAIIGYAELFAEELHELAPEVARDDLDHIQVAARHLLGLINDILDLSKIEAGKMTLICADTPLEPLAREALITVEPLAARHQTTLRLCREEGAASDEALSAWCEGPRVRQILTNLLSNAVKFSPEGDVTLSLGREDDVVICRVSDTGVGIRPEALARLFQAFEQSEEGKLAGGTGLGLTISRELARLMGGSLSAQSVYGEGTTMTLTLPLRPRL